MLRDRVDAAAREVLAITGVPSASLAVVTDGQIAYLQAYGDASVEPRRPARPEMRYSIGSISKQFTAAAILMLAEEHKLSLDDSVARFVPTVTRAGEVTIRQLLARAEEAWPELLRHLDDKHYSFTDNQCDCAYNNSVGDVCRRIIEETLTEAYFRYSPESPGD